MGPLGVSGLVAGIITVVVGLILIIWPRFIAYVIGIYLLIVGGIAIFNSV